MRVDLPGPVELPTITAADIDVDAVERLATERENAAAQHAGLCDELGRRTAAVRRIRAEIQRLESDAARVSTRAGGADALIVTAREELADVEARVAATNAALEASLDVLGETQDSLPAIARTLRGLGVRVRGLERVTPGGAPGRVDSIPATRRGER